MSQPTDTRVLDVEGLEVHFAERAGLFNRQVGTVRAVDGVSFTIDQKETLGLVGESGSGKTTIGRSILRALDPTGGRVGFHLEGDVIDLASLSGKSLRRIRRHMQMIFQDPYSSLNPRMTVRDIIAEPLIVNKLCKGAELEERVRDMALQCKLNVEHLRRYPHAFSGGQRQRIGIARALVTNPSFVVADESVSALDVSIQAEILNLLDDLQEQLGVAILFIAHDLSVVAHLSHRVAVMYLGQLVELCETKQLFTKPRHPYTEALLSAIPAIDPSQGMRLIPLLGEVPSASNPPAGCRFHTRCPYAEDRCKTDDPEWREIEPGHMVRCHFSDSLELRGAEITS